MEIRGSGISRNCLSGEYQGCGVGVGGVGPFWSRGVGVGFLNLLESGRSRTFLVERSRSWILKLAGVGVGLFPSDSAALVSTHNFCVSVHSGYRDILCYPISLICLLI